MTTHSMSLIKTYAFELISDQTPAHAYVTVHVFDLSCDMGSARANVFQGDCYWNFMIFIYQLTRAGKVLCEMLTQILTLNLSFAFFLYLQDITSEFLKMSVLSSAFEIADKVCQCLSTKTCVCVWVCMCLGVYVCVYVCVCLCGGKGL